MAGWGWLTAAKARYDHQFVVRVLVKAVLLFVLVNVLYVFLQPLPLISRLSVYNSIIPGRLRFPYSDNPDEAFNLSLQRIEGLFAAHVIDQGNEADEYRVAILGDSSVWGVLLDNSETLSACLNREGLITENGQRVEIYNLGYPVLSLFKDVLILEEAVEKDVDAVIWLTTLQAFFDNEQLRHPIVRNNRDRAESLIRQYDLSLDLQTLSQEGFFDRTLIVQRRALSDWLRLQVFGLAWWITKDDYAPAEFFGAPVSNLPASTGILNRPDVSTGNLLEQGVLAIDVFRAGLELASQNELPVIVVNEPIFISQGLNADVRYNEYYPRWAYDEYRAWLVQEAEAQNFAYLDLWDAVPSTAFTDTPFHYTADFTCAVAERIAEALSAQISAGS
jgi:hypothetical protein